MRAWWLRSADVIGLRTAVRRDRGRLGDLVGRASVVADRGLVWLGLGGAMLVAPRTRPAGLAALAAVAAEAGLAKSLKPLAGRSRPPWWTRVRSRDLGRQPSSRSMPSSHTGNAAAFTSAVCLQLPGIAVPLVVFSGVVGLSRLTTARHYPSDVAVGLLTGVAVGAVAGGLARRLRRTADH